MVFEQGESCSNSSNESKSVVARGDYSLIQKVGAMVYTAGITPRVNGELCFRGIVGRDITTSEAAAAAGIAVQQALQAVKERLGRISFVPIQMTVYVRSDPCFEDISAVADGASAELKVAANASPARTAIGVASLPGGAPVEVSLVLHVV